MTRLFKAELRRILARRLVRVTLAVGLLAIVVGGVLAFTTSGALSEAQFRQRAHAADVQRNAQNERIRQCLQAHGAQPGDNLSDQVARECIPNKQEPTAHDPRFHRVRLEGILKGTSGVLAIVGWALGASLVGAEFASRSMTTLLTWETRRLRVILAKTAVVMASMFVIAVVALSVLAAAMLPALLAHGAPFHAGDPQFAQFAGIIVRGALLATLASGMGLAIATLGRNTAAALGVGFAYIIVLENILGSSLRNWRRWLLLGNAIVFVSGKNGGDIPGRSVTGAGVFLAAIAVTLLLGAATSFRTRDLA